MMLQKNAKTGEVELIKVEPVEEEEFTDVITEPTVEERLAQTDELLRTFTMAFTEYVFTQEMGDDS